MWFTAIGGAVAGISGIVLAGGLIELYSMLATYSHVFKYYYLSMIILLLPVLYFACSLKSSSTDDWRIKDVLKLLIAPLKIYSFFSMHSQTKYSSLIDELDNVNKLLGMSPDLSEKKLIYYLKSPDYFVRTTAMYSMYNLQLKDEIKSALLNCVKDYSSVHGPVGAIILAKNNFTTAIPYFRNGLHNENGPIVWGSIMALAIMKDKVSYKKIIQLFNEAENQILIYYCAIAIGMMRDKKNLSCLLDKLSYSAALSTDVVNSIVDSVTKIISCDKVFYKYIRLLDHDHDKGISGLIDIIDCSRVPGLPDTPETLIVNSLNENDETKRKKIFINYLKAALELDTPEMKELILFKNYLTKTKPDLISNRLVASIFIKIFGKTETADEDVKQKENIIALNRVEKPAKLTAAIIFLSFSYFLHALNRSIDLSNITGITQYYVVNILVLGLVCVTWLTYLINKGKNWARLFLLIYFIFLIPRVINDMFNYVTFDPIAYAHQCVQVVFLILGIIFLFSKESSNWFKSIKLEKNNTHAVCRSYKVSSIFFYISLGLAGLNMFTVFHGWQAFDKFISHSSFNFISFVIENALMSFAINILFIQAIRNGSKLAGVIYLALIVLAAYVKDYAIILGFVPYPFFYPWVTRIVLQIVAFIILFQKDIVSVYNRLTRKT